MEKAIGIKNRYYTANNLGVGKWCIFNCHLLHFLLAKNNDMHDTRRFMKRNGYRKAKLEFPFMDYEDIRLITGKGNILRLQDKNGRWEQP